MRKTDTDLATRIWARARITANELGAEFTITPADTLMPERCPILGGWMIGPAAPDANMRKPAIVRRDPARGYVPGNVEVVSRLAAGMISRRGRAAVERGMGGLVTQSAARCAHTPRGATLGHSAERPIPKPRASPPARS